MQFIANVSDLSDFWFFRFQKFPPKTRILYLAQDQPKKALGWAFFGPGPLVLGSGVWPNWSKMINFDQNGQVWSLRPGPVLRFHLRWPKSCPSLGLTSRTKSQRLFIRWKYAIFGQKPPENLPPRSLNCPRTAFSGVLGPLPPLNAFR